jgi:hypothetical protein
MPRAAENLTSPRPGDIEPRSIGLNHPCDAASAQRRACVRATVEEGEIPTTDVEDADRPTSDDEQATLAGAKFFGRADTN